MLKKILSTVLLLSLCFALALPAFAAGGSYGVYQASGLVSSKPELFPLPDLDWGTYDYIAYRQSSSQSYSLVTFPKTTSTRPFVTIGDQGTVNGVQNTVLTLVVTGGSEKVQVWSYDSDGWVKRHVTDKSRITLASASGSSVTYGEIFATSVDIPTFQGDSFFLQASLTPSPPPLGEVVETMQGAKIRELLIPSLEDCLTLLVPFGIGLLSLLTALVVLPRGSR